MADAASDDSVGRLAAAEAERDKIREKLHNAVRVGTLLPHNDVIRFGEWGAATQMHDQLQSALYFLKFSHTKSVSLIEHISLYLVLVTES